MYAINRIYSSSVILCCKKLMTLGLSNYNIPVHYIEYTLFSPVDKGIVRNMDS